MWQLISNSEMETRIVPTNLTGGKGMHPARKDPTHSKLSNNNIYFEKGLCIISIFEDSKASLKTVGMD